MRLRILHKGLAFLLLPLALQAFLFYQLRQLTQKAEALSRYAEISSERLYFFDLMIIEFASGWTEIGQAIFAKNASPIDPESLHRKLREAISSCRPVSVGNERMRVILDDAQVMADAEYRQLKAAGSQASDTDAVTHLRDFFVTFRKMQVGMRPQLAMMKEQANLERAEFLRTKQQEESYRQQIDAQVTVGIVADLILAIALLAWFLSNITDRLSSLVQNAQLIPSGKPLTRHVGGSDELAYLDGVIHQVSDSLKLAAEHRKSLMEMVAHDLRSPLMSARLALDTFLTRGAGDPEETRTERIQSVRVSLGRLISLVEDLLTIEKLEANKLELNREIVDVNEVVNESLASMETLARSKKLVLENSTQPTHVDADKLRLLQVLNNLISNAIKHSPDGGTIRIATSTKPDRLIFSVSDQGPGVSPEQQAGLFSKFYQVNAIDEQGGFGLGLAITKLIVSAHGGEVGVNCEEGGGSTFWFSLPCDVDLTQPV